MKNYIETSSITFKEFIDNLYITFKLIVSTNIISKPLYAEINASNKNDIIINTVYLYEFVSDILTKKLKIGDVVDEYFKNTTHIPPCILDLIETKNKHQILVNDCYN